MDEIFEEFDSIVSEMASDPSGMVPVSAEILAAVTDGDDDPKFATFVIESGWSKQKRFWGPELFGQVAAEMNAAASTEPIVGYMGHIKPEDHGFIFPEIQLQWVGAKLLQTGEKARMAVKAYVLPGTKARDYLRRGLVKTVSWRGLMAGTPYQKGERVEKFQIESIDLSRPRAAGMSAKLAGALTSEMEERSDKVKTEEIAALTENELRAHNPKLVEGVEEAATKPLATQVSEMEETIKASAPVVEIIPQLRGILGLKEDTDAVDVIQAAITHLKSEGKKLREGILDTVLGKRFKDADTSLVRRILVGEMEARDVKLTGNSDDDEKVVSEMVTTIIDGDEQLKTAVSEMQEAPPNLGGTTSENEGGSVAWKPGMSTSNVRVKARS